ncbi:hypothetical protein BRX37_10260 [Sphingomonas sp. S-NIH.Pt3_0716]|nr:hypothetical protein BRX37_10260 [Sphingomonas sp. S-NIH.Pt3_0716]
MQICLKYPTDEVDRFRIMFQLLAVLAARLRNNVSAEPKRRGLTVPEPVDGVRDHSSADMLAVFS